MGLINAILSDLLPFKFRNSAMWIVLKLERFVSGKSILVPVDFKFDTGACGILLSREAFEYLGYKSLKPIRAITISGVEGVRRGIFRGTRKGIPGKEYRIPTFQVAGTLYAKNPIVRVPDKLNRCRNLLGQSILHTRDFLVDNEESVVMFGHKDASGRTIPPTKITSSNEYEKYLD